MMKFNAFGVKLIIKYPAIAVICLAMFTSYKDDLLIPLCLLSSVIHEAGHLLFICRFVGKPDSIIINPGEIKINSNLSGVSYTQDIIITLAGVAFNFFTSVLSYLLYLMFSAELFFDFALCNVCIGTFNLLPVKTFDGGQLLYNFLLRKLSAGTSDKIINIITMLIVIPLATVAFYVLLTSKFNYTLLIVAIYAISIIISKEMR